LAGLGGIKSDGNGGVYAKKTSFVTVIAVAGALGWGGADLLLGPAKVREDERLKAHVEALEDELQEHKISTNIRIQEAELRAEKAADKIDKRLTTFEAKLDQAIREMVRSRSGG